MSEELEKIKPTETKLMIQGKEREIKFTFSSWAKLEEKYGGVQNFNKIEDDLNNHPFKSIPELLYIGLTDKEGVTVENILDGYDLSNIEEIVTVLSKALYGSLPSDNKKKSATKKTTVNKS